MLDQGRTARSQSLAKIFLPGNPDTAAAAQSPTFPLSPPSGWRSQAALRPQKAQTVPLTGGPSKSS